MYIYFHWHLVSVYTNMYVFGITHLASRNALDNFFSVLSSLYCDLVRAHFYTEAGTLELHIIGIHSEIKNQHLGGIDEACLSVKHNPSVALSLKLATLLGNVLQENHIDPTLILASILLNDV